MATLKTNYKDDMFSGDRKYREIRNSDGTVSFEDVTVYSQTGDVFASADINATNTEVNTINASLTEKVTQKEGNISVEGSTISSTALDWVTWDETNGRMILHKKGTGADAGFPFSGGKIKEYLTFSNRPYSYGGYQVVGGLFITDSLTVIPDGTSTDDFLQMQDLLSAYHFYSTSTITVSKEGYYIINESAVTHHDIGDIVSGGTYATIWNIFYLGETNPFE